jgi:hypothetical protein
MDLILSREGVDGQECDLLVSGFFQDERPLKGTTGWIDWRFNGRLSRLVMDERLTGIWKETTLMPSDGRIAPKLLLLLGLGKSKEYSYLHVRGLFPHVLETIKNLRASSICLSLPHGGGYAVDVDCGKLIEIFLEGVRDCLDQWPQGPDEEWIKTLRVFLAEEERRISEILLAVQAAQSALGDRLRIRVLVPSA